MIEIRAQGIREGKGVLVECDFTGDGIEFLFNGSQDIDLEGAIRDEMEEHHPMAGTYFPETEKLNLINVLDGYFFDSNPDIEVEGEVETMPNEEGLIY